MAWPHKNKMNTNRTSSQEAFFNWKSQIQIKWIKFHSEVRIFAFREISLYLLFLRAVV